MPTTCKVVTASPPAFWPVNQPRTSPWIDCPPSAVRIAAVIIPRQAAAVNPAYEASVRLYGTRNGAQTIDVLSDSGKGSGYADALAPRRPEGERGVVEPDVKTIWELEWVDDRTNPAGETVAEWGDSIYCSPQILDTTNLRVQTSATCHGGFSGDCWFAVVLIAFDSAGLSLDWDVTSWRQ